MNRSARRRTVVAIGVLAVLVLLGGCMGTGTNGDDPANASGFTDLTNGTDGSEGSDRTNGDDSHVSDADETQDSDGEDENGDKDDQDSDDADRTHPGDGDDTHDRERDELSDEVADRLRTDDTLHPGEFTAFESGLLVGAHPHAMTEPHEIDLSTFDPTDPRAPTAVEAYELHDPNIEKRGSFLELKTRGGDPLGSANHTEFYVTIPVPEELDEEHLAVLSYEANHIELPPGTGVEDPEPRPESWKWRSVTYDEEFDAVVVQVEAIGGTEHPTRLGVVEHASKQTTPESQAYDYPDVTHLTTQYFPTVETEWDPDPIRPPDIPEHGSHVFQDDFSMASDTAFLIKCNAANCNTTVRKDHQNYLDHAYSVYFNSLQGDPYPDLRTEKVQVYVESGVVTKEFYEYNIEDYNSDSGCEDSPGWYSKRISPFAGHAYTCLTWDEPDNEANSPLATTGHELFHAMQYSYRKGITSDDIIVEATARLAQDYQHPAESAFKHPNSLPFLNSSMPEGAYAWDDFYEHLLVTDSTVDFSDLPVLFEDGMNFDSLEVLLGEDGHRSAYWEFVKDTVYEHSYSTVYNASTWSTPDSCQIDIFEQSNATAFDMNLPVGDLLGTPEDGPVYPYGVLNWNLEDLEAFSSAVTNISLPAEGYEPYYAIIDVETAGGEQMGVDTWMATVYDDVASEYEDCAEDNWLEDEAGGEFRVPVYGVGKNVYLLQSNLDDSEQRFVNAVEFEPIPEEEIPTPEVADTTLDYPRHPDDHDGGITHPLSIENPAGDTGDLSVSPSSVWTDAGNLMEITTDFELRYELHDEHQYSRSSLSDGQYTDEQTIEVTNERYNLTSQGNISVHRDLNPITYDVNYSLSWGLEDVDPLTPPPGPVCQRPENRFDVNPANYVSTPFGSTELFVVDVWGADPRIGTVSVRDDEKTVTYQPNEELHPWHFEDFGPDGYLTGPTCSYLDSFTYEVENSFQDRVYTGNAQAEVHIYDPVDEEFELPPVTTEDWLDVYVDFLNLEGDIDIQIDTVGGFQSGGYGLVMFQQDGQRSAYLRPGPDADWQRLVAEPGGDLVMTALAASGLSSGWVAGNEYQGVRVDSSGQFWPLPADGESVALDVNTNGEVVGHAIVGESTTSPTAVLWTHETPFALDSDLEGGSLATALTDDRQIVGIHGIPHLEGGLSGAAINPAHGVLDSLRSDLLAAGVQAFHYDWSESGHPAEGAVTDLGSLGGGTIPTDVSDRGAVVGASVPNPKDPERFQAFYWEGGQMQGIDLPEESVRSTATGVNDDRFVVGNYELATGDTRGFLWHPRDGITHLDEMLVHEDWTVIDATNIDNDHQVQVTVQVTGDAQWQMTLDVPR